MYAPARFIVVNLTRKAANDLIQEAICFTDQEHVTLDLVN